MPKKLSYEEVKEQFSQYGFELIDTEYKNNQTKMTFKNKDGYIGCMSLGNLKSGKNTQYISKFNPYSIYNIKLYLINNNSDTTLLSEEFVDSETPLLFKCGCGKIFRRSWLGLSGQKYLTCNECSLSLRGKTRRVPFDRVKEDFLSFGYTVLSSPEEYYSNTTRLLCMDKDGYLGYLSYNKRDQIFTKFSLNKNSKNNVIHNINLYARLNNITATCIGFCEEDRWTSQGILCRCECGNTFTTSIFSFMNGKTRCDYCTNKTSRLEILTKKWLEDNNIKHIKQYRFNGCKNVISLPFDFYIPSKNTLIEVDGEGHYQVAYFNNCSYDKALESYHRIKHTDSIKNKYCKDKNITLIRIPYWEYKDDTYKNTLYTNLIKE